MLKLACHDRLKNWHFFLSSNVILELTMKKLWKLRQAYQKLRSVAKSDFNSFSNWADQLFRIFLFLRMQLQLTFYAADLWECTVYGNKDYYIVAKGLILLEN